MTTTTPTPPAKTSTRESRSAARVAQLDPHASRIWDHVHASPLGNLWSFQGVPPLVVFKRTFNALQEDNLVSRAAELGYYFLFALFPTLVCASALVGLVAKSASQVYSRLLDYLSLIVPHDALTLVLQTFNQTATHSSGGKFLFGLAAALWSASVGFSAIQDTLNIVYKAKETRPYWKARGSAILVTLLLSVVISITLACLLAGTWLSHLVRAHIWHAHLGLAYGIAIHLFFDVCTALMLVLLFAVIYYFAPDIKNKQWRWLTPGATIGILGWFLASLALRLYLHYFNSYSVTYGSLGAVIILLTWFYITGLMLLIGAEINSEIEACAAETKLKAMGEIPHDATPESTCPTPTPS